MSFFCDKKFYEWREFTASFTVVISELTVHHEKKCDNYKLHPENHSQISSKIFLLKTNKTMKMNVTFIRKKYKYHHHNSKGLNRKRERQGFGSRKHCWDDFDKSLLWSRKIKVIWLEPESWYSSQIIPVSRQAKKCTKSVLCYKIINYKILR